MLIAALAVIGDLSVVLYYDHTTTVTVNIVVYAPGNVPIWATNTAV